VIESRFQPDLLPDEQVVWTGQPDAGRILDASDILLIPFSLLWGGFAIFWEANALGWAPLSSGRPAPTFFILWGVPFVLVGLYMIFGRFIHKVWTRKRTYYALTTKRALILTETWGRSVRSFNLDRLPGITTSSRGDGSGSIVFSPSGFPATMGFFGFGSSRRRFAPPGFYDIPDVRLVAQQIDDLRRY
jgi:hypothetical protein